MAHWLKAKMAEYKLFGYNDNGAFWNSLPNTVKFALSVLVVFVCVLMGLNGIPGLTLGALSKIVAVSLLMSLGQGIIKGDILKPLFYTTLAATAYYTAMLYAIPAIVVNAVLVAVILGGVANAYYGIDKKQEKRHLVSELFAGTKVSFVWRTLSRFVGFIPVVAENGINYAMGRQHIGQILLNDLLLAQKGILSFANRLKNSYALVAAFSNQTLVKMKSGVSFTVKAIKLSLILAAVLSTLAVLGVAGLYFTGNIAVALPTLLALKASAISMAATVASASLGFLSASASAIWSNFLPFIAKSSMGLILGSSIMLTLGMIAAYAYHELKYPIHNLQQPPVHQAVGANQPAAANRPADEFLSRWGVWRSVAKFVILMNLVTTSAMIALCALVPVNLITVPVITISSLVMGLHSGMAFVRIFKDFFNNTPAGQILAIVKEVIEQGMDLGDVVLKERATILNLYKLVEKFNQNLAAVQNRAVLPALGNMIGVPNLPQDPMELMQNPKIAVGAIVTGAATVEVIAAGIAAVTSPLIAVPLFGVAALEANKEGRSDLAKGLAAMAASSVVGFGPAVAVPLVYKAAVNVRDNNLGLASVQAGGAYLAAVGPLSALSTAGTLGLLATFGDSAYRLANDKPIDVKRMLSLVAISRGATWTANVILPNVFSAVGYINPSMVVRMFASASVAGICAKEAFARKEALKLLEKTPQGWHLSLGEDALQHQRKEALALTASSALGVLATVAMYSPYVALDTVRIMFGTILDSRVLAVASFSVTGLSAFGDYKRTGQYNAAMNIANYQTLAATAAFVAWSNKGTLASNVASIAVATPAALLSVPQALLVTFGPTTLGAVLSVSVLGTRVGLLYTEGVRSLSEFKADPIVQAGSALVALTSISALGVAHGIWAPTFASTSAIYGKKAYDGFSESFSLHTDEFMPWSINEGKKEVALRAIKQAGISYTSAALALGGILPPATVLSGLKLSVSPEFAGTLLLTQFCYAAHKAKLNDKPVLDRANITTLTALSGMLSLSLDNPMIVTAAVTASMSKLAFENLRHVPISRDPNSALILSVAPEHQEALKAGLMQGAAAISSALATIALYSPQTALSIMNTLVSKSTTNAVSLMFTLGSLAQIQSDLKNGMGDLKTCQNKATQSSLKMAALLLTPELLPMAVSFATDSPVYATGVLLGGASLYSLRDVAIRVKMTNAKDKILNKIVETKETLLNKASPALARLSALYRNTIMALKAALQQADIALAEKERQRQQGKPEQKSEFKQSKFDLDNSADNLLDQLRELLNSTKSNQKADESVCIQAFEHEVDVFEDCQDEFDATRPIQVNAQIHMLPVDRQGLFARQEEQELDDLDEESFEESFEEPDTEMDEEREAQSQLLLLMHAQMQLREEALNNGVAVQNRPSSPQIS